METWIEELYHHGIKGQKWGIRRYQNPDGTLTELGKKRLEVLGKNVETSKKNDAFEAKMRSVLEYEKKEAGVSEDYRTIKKGSVLSRIASEDDDRYDTRKYMSILKDDVETYDSQWEWFTQDPYKYQYTATKDLKVATKEEVASRLVEKFANVPASEFLKDYKPYGATSIDNKLLKDIKNMSIKDLYREGTESYNKLADYTEYFHEKSGIPTKEAMLFVRRNEFMNDALQKFYADKLYRNKKAAEELLKEFKDMKYDAILDIEDAGEFAKYPLIVLDPKKSMKLKKKLGPNDDWYGK